MQLVFSIYHFNASVPLYMLPFTFYLMTDKLMWKSQRPFHGAQNSIVEGSAAEAFYQVQYSTTGQIKNTFFSCFWSWILAQDLMKEISDLK